MARAFNAGEKEGCPGEFEIARAAGAWRDRRYVSAPQRRGTIDVQPTVMDEGLAVGQRADVWPVRTDEDGNILVNHFVRRCTATYSNACSASTG